MSTHISTNVWFDDDDRVEASDLDVGRTVITTIDIGPAFGGSDVTIFLQTREQAEHLFDAVADATMRWRERDPEVATIDAVIDPAITDAITDDSLPSGYRKPAEPVEVRGKSGSVIGYTLPGRGEAMFPTRDDALSFEDRLNDNLDNVGDAIKGMRPASR